MSWVTIANITLIAVAALVVVIGIKLIRGSWRIPEADREKVVTVTIGAAILTGITSLIMAIRPSRLKRTPNPGKDK